MEIPPLPEWVEDHAIHIFSGMEQVAYKNRGGNWFIKIGRCNQCGKCCTNLKSHPFPLIDGQCVYLKKEPGNNDQWLCGLGLNRPFGCSIVKPNMEECTEKFEELK